MPAVERGRRRNRGPRHPTPAVGALVELDGEIIILARNATWPDGWNGDVLRTLP